MIIGGVAVGGLVLVGAIGVFLFSGGKGRNNPNGDQQQAGTTDAGNGLGGGSSEKEFVPDPLPTGAFGWPLTPDAQTFEWPETVELPVTDTGWAAVFSHATPGYAVTGFEGSHVTNTESWSLFNGEKIGKIEQETPDARMRSLGPKGEVLAIRPDERGHKHRVEVWSYKTGQKLAAMECEETSREISSLAFLGNNRLLTFSSTYADGQFQNILRLFDVDSQKEIASEALDDRWNLKSAGISANGKYLARVTSKGELLVYETQDLKRAAFAKFDAPRFGVMGGVAFNSTGDKIASLWGVGERSAIYVTDVQNGFTEKAAEFSGSLLYSPVSGEIYMGRSLQWLTDDSGWLVYGRGVVDATSKQLVWLFDSKLEGATAPRSPVPNGILVQVGDLSIRKQLRMLEIPWESIRESVSAAESDTEARLKQGSEVAVDIQVGAIRFADKNQVKSQLTDVVEKRLRGDRFTISKDADVTLNVIYSEAAGRQVSKLGDFRGENAFESTTAKFNLKWLAKGVSSPVLEIEIPVSPRLLRVKDSNPQGYRNAIFEKAMGDLKNILLLSYVGAGDDPVVLPGVTIFK